MSKQNGAAAPNTEPAANAKRQSALMVCVTGQRACERLIERGVLVRNGNEKMFVVHCAQTGHKFLNYQSEPDAIEYLFTCASLADAELTILRENNVIDALVDFAVSNGVTRIILGASPTQNSDSFAARFAARLNDVEFIVVE